MAIYHLHAHTIGRSRGQSAVAAAAYRLCARMRDERIGKTIDYRPKRWQLVQGYKVGAVAELDQYSTEEYLNSLERAEKRKDAQLLKELEVALPREMAVKHANILLNEFVSGDIKKYGIRCIIAVHDKRDGNPHAHILYTMRPESLVDGKVVFGKKVRDLDRKDWLLSKRREWAEVCNRILLDPYQDQPTKRIDHRSLKDQHIKREPTLHIGWRVGKVKDLKAKLAKLSIEQAKQEQAEAELVPEEKSWIEKNMERLEREKRQKEELLKKRIQDRSRDRGGLGY